MSDHMQDVEYLLNYLGIGSFSVIGLSGGGPYALAAASYFSRTRLLKTSIFCGISHPEFEQTTVSMKFKFQNWAWKWASWLNRNNVSIPGNELWRDINSAKDNPRSIAFAKAKDLARYRQGVREYVNDYALASRAWDFELRDIAAGPIRWYHGNMDIYTYRGCKSDCTACERSQTQQH